MEIQLVRRMAKGIFLIFIALSISIAFSEIEVPEDISPDTEVRVGEFHSTNSNSGSQDDDLTPIMTVVDSPPFDLESSWYGLNLRSLGDINGDGPTDLCVLTHSCGGYVDRPPDDVPFLLQGRPAGDLNSSQYRPCFRYGSKLPAIFGSLAMVTNTAQYWIALVVLMAGLCRLDHLFCRSAMVTHVRLEYEWLYFFALASIFEGSFVVAVYAMVSVYVWRRLRPWLIRRSRAASEACSVRPRTARRVKHLRPDHQT